MLNHDALDRSISMPFACDGRLAAFRREAQSPLAMSPASCDDARLMRRTEMQRDIGALRAVRGFVIVCALAMCLGSGWRAGMSSRLLAAAQQPAETTLPDKVKLFIPFRTYTQEENDRVLALYKYLRVADVSDGMDLVGLQDIGTVDESIRPLWKDTERFTHRVHGIAVTARYVPTNTREPKIDNARIGQLYNTATSEAFMPMLFPGAVLVVDAMEDGESRSAGSTNILAWQKLGMRAFITSGGLADSDDHSPPGAGVFPPSRPRHTARPEPAGVGEPPGDDRRRAGASRRRGGRRR